MAHWSQIQLCLRCKKELVPGKRRDAYCSARCKRRDRREEIKFNDQHRRADPDHGWF